MADKSKLDLLREFAARDPKNAFPRYGVAMELVQLGRLEDAAAEFDALAREQPAYLPAYYHAGKVLERLGRLEEARGVYRRGAAVATAAGNPHAREEIEAALAALD